MAHVNMITFPTQDGDFWYVAPNKEVKSTPNEMDVRRKSCLWCKKEGAFAVQDVIQFGFERDIHHTTFYCPSCLNASTFIYTIESED